MLRVKPPTGTELLEMRLVRLLTQRDAADQIGCSVRAYQHWEGGAVPQFRWQRALIEWANGSNGETKDAA